MGTHKSVSRCVGDVVGVFFFLGAVILSNSIDDSRNVAIRGPREIHMIEDHMRTKCEKRMTCWLSFPL
jgi:hypothetical protein